MSSYCVKFHLFAKNHQDLVQDLDQEQDLDLDRDKNQDKPLDLDPCLDQDQDLDNGLEFINLLIFMSPNIQGEENISIINPSKIITMRSPS